MGRQSTANDLTRNLKRVCDPQLSLQVASCPGEQLGQAQIREAVSQHSDSQTSPEAQRQDAVAEYQRALCSLLGPCVHSNRFLSEEI